MNEEIKVAIIEDEETWSKGLAAMLNDFGYTVTGIADNFESAVTLLNTPGYDIVLLDINLVDRNSGIEIGKMINTLYRKPFIFITATTEPAILAEAVNTHPSAYLSKPVHRASLIATIQSAIYNFNERISPPYNTTSPNSDMFFVKQGMKYKKLNWANIVSLKSDKNYTVIFNAIDKTEYFIRSTLSKTLEYIIPAHLQASFIQINRAEAIQIPFITELTGEELKTAYNTYTVTDSYANGLKKAMNVII